MTIRFYIPILVLSIFCALSSSAQIPCSDDCVYPGNATAGHPVISNDIPNLDPVDVEDLLLIGMGYGQTGFSRDDMGIDFNPKHCEPWPSNFNGDYNPINLKHADTDGDGIIGISDTVAISQNYGLYVGGDCGDLSWIPTIMGDGTDPCYCTMEAFDYNGTTLYVKNSLCMAFDGPSEIYTCDGEFICFFGGLASPYCDNDILSEMESIGIVWDCDSECELCTTDYDPVCAEGITFNNSCEAECAGYSSWTPGECSSSTCPYLDEIYDIIALNPAPFNYGADYYEFEGQTVIHLYLCSPELISDGMETIYDCDGNVICNIGGIAGFTCPGFPEEATGPTELYPCPAETTTMIYNTICNSEGFDQFWEDLGDEESLSLSQSAQNGTSTLVPYGAFHGAHLNYTPNADFVGKDTVIITRTDLMPFQEDYWVYVFDVEDCSGTEPCICTSIYEPVCVEGITFSNACEANCAGYTTGIVAGECPSTSGCPYEDELYTYLSTNAGPIAIGADIYEFNGETVYVTKLCNPGSVADWMDVVTDCDGNIVCQIGGIAGFVCPGFPETATFLGTFYDCPPALELAEENEQRLENTGNTIGSPSEDDEAARIRSELVNEMVLPNGDILFDFDVILENDGSDPVLTEAYGVAFKASFSSSLPTVANVAFTDESDNTLSWLGDPNSSNPSDQILTMHKKQLFTGGGVIDIASTRIDQNTVIGTGRICKILCVATIDDWGVGFSSLDMEEGELSLSLERVMLVNANGERIATVSEPITVPINRNPAVRIQGQAYLEGPLDKSTGIMSTELMTAQLLPVDQPYSNSPWNYEGIEKVEDFSALGQDIVDWVMIEVRSSDGNYTILEQRAALINSTGQILDIDGLPGVNFFKLIEGSSYYFILRHRNHLAVMTQNPIGISSGIGTADFTDDSLVNGSNQLLGFSNDGGVSYMLRAGDFNADGVITTSDFNEYLSASSALNQYLNSDCNLDRAVTVADFNFYLPNSSLIGVQQVRY